MYPTNAALGNLSQQGSRSPMNSADASHARELEEVKKESMEHVLFASAQSLALAKLKVYSAMAKTINDQQ